MHLRYSQLRDDELQYCNIVVQNASLNVLIVIAGSFFEQGEEYSTLPRGYDKIEEDDGDYDYDGVDSEYYFEDVFKL